MKKLLITGASGFLGWNLCRRGSSLWDVFGLAGKNRIDIHGVKSGNVDLTDFDEVGELFRAIRPDAVIHAAAASDPNFCQLHPAESHRINVDATVNLAGLCADRGIPFVFTSTDLVFDGLAAPFREEDPVSPVSIYGEQKAEAEAAVLNRWPHAAVCRMSLMFGEPGPAAQSFIQPMIAAMKEDREIRLFTDEFRTPLSGRDAARGLLLALEKARGLLHLGGAERISRFDFGRMLSSVLEIPAHLVPCTRSSVPMPAPRPPDVSLDSTKAAGLGFRPRALRQELEWLLRFGRTAGPVSAGRDR